MSVFEQVKEVVVEKLSVSEDQVTPEAHFIDDLGADSLLVTDLVMGIEDKFDITIEDEEAEDIMTVQSAVDLVEKKLK